MTQYGLRPYFVAGGGVVGAPSTCVATCSMSTRRWASSISAGGVTGFLTDRVGVNWDVRYFRSVGGKEGTGLSFGREQLSFWRATMGVAIRLGAVEP